MPITQCGRWQVAEYGSSIDLGAERDGARIRAILQGAVNKAALDGVLAEKPAPYVRIAAIKDGVITFRMLYCLNGGSISPVKVNHIVLVYAVHFLKAAGIPVTRIQHTDVSPPAMVGQYHIDQPQARLAMLGSVGFFSILPPADLATVAAEVVTLRLPAGHQLLLAGEPGDSMFAVSEGSLDVTIDERGRALQSPIWNQSATTDLRRRFRPTRFICRGGIRGSNQFGSATDKRYSLGVVLPW